MMQFLRVFFCAIFCAAISATTLAAERKAPVTEPVPANLEQRVGNLEQLLQNQGLLDMLQKLQALQTEIGNLRGQVEVNNHELEQLQEKQRSLYNDIDQRLQKIEGKKVSAAGAPAAAAPPLEVMTPTESVETAGAQAESSLTVENVAPASPAQSATAVAAAKNTAQEQQPAAPDNPLAVQSEYQQAFNLLKQAQYDKAIKAFDAFLGKYPQSQYSDNAQYWMGEAYFVTRRYNEAITEYMQLVTNYPQSQKAPNSLLKIGYSYYELKQDAEAKKVLQDLIQHYPGTPAAQDAEKRLHH